MLLGHDQASEVQAERPEGPPSRADIESHLINGGIALVVARTSHLSMRDIFVRQLASARAFAVLAVLPLVWYVGCLAVAQLTDATPSRLFTIALFDIAAGGLVVLLFVACTEARRRGGSAAARRVALVGGTAIAAYVAMPHILFSLGFADAHFGDGIEPASDLDVTDAAEEQPVESHLAVVGAGIGAGALLGPMWIRGMLRSASRGLMNTVREVLGTLPVIVATLFFLSFVEEIWLVVGEMSVAHLVAVNGLLLFCVVRSVRSLAQEEAEALLEPIGQQAATTSATRPAAPAKPAPAPEKDSQIGWLTGAGIAPRSYGSDDNDIKDLVVRLWTALISLRVILAGAIIAVIAFVVSALTTTEPILDGWLEGDPHGTTLAPFGFELYLSTEAIAVSVLVGAFAMVAFTAYTLGEPEKCEELLAPSRTRMSELLTLAATYEEAAKQGHWRRGPGARWRDHAAFVADEPTRGSSRPRSFGMHWRPSAEANGKSQGWWRACWNPATGELYAAREHGPVELLAVCDDGRRVDEALDGWQQAEREPNGIGWLRERAASLVAAQNGAGPATA